MKLKEVYDLPSAADDIDEDGESRPLMWSSEGTPGTKSPLSIVKPSRRRHFVVVGLALALACFGMAAIFQTGTGTELLDKAKELAHGQWSEPLPETDFESETKGVPGLTPQEEDEILFDDPIEMPPSVSVVQEPSTTVAHVAEPTSEPTATSLANPSSEPDDDDDDGDDDELVEDLPQLQNMTLLPGFIDTRLPAPSLMPAPAGRERFLSYLPHSGFHNQRIELQNAIMLASMTNRTLLVPLVRLGRPLPWAMTPRLQNFWDTQQKSSLDHCTDFLEELEAGQDVSTSPTCKFYTSYTREFAPALGKAILICSL